MPAADFFIGPNQWVVDKLSHVEKERVHDITIDAELRLAGSRIQINITIMPLGEHSGSIIMIEDITREKRLKSTMSRYMDPSVAAKLLESPEDVLGGQSSLVTVLFSDVRGFTGIAEALGAADTVALLNELFTEMVDCIQHEGGMLDKFIGDALMAEFGIPLAHDDDEDRAVRAAIRMHRKLGSLNLRRIQTGRCAISIGIGINTDIVVSGNIGSPKRMDYTVIGDGVNLASRIESACKEYHAGLLIGESTFEKLRGSYKSREVDRVVLKGKTEPVAVYEILDYHTDESFPQMDNVLKAFKAGLQFYREGRWDEAINAFGAAVEFNPQDFTSVMYLNRCKSLKKAGPGSTWTGIWVMESK